MYWSLILWLFYKRFHQKHSWLISGSHPSCDQILSKSKEAWLCRRRLHAPCVGLFWKTHFTGLQSAARRMKTRSRSRDVRTFALGALEQWASWDGRGRVGVSKRRADKGLRWRTLAWQGDTRPSLPPARLHGKLGLWAAYLANLYKSGLLPSPHLILTANLGDSYCYYRPHFTDKETKAREKMAHPRSHFWRRSRARTQM